MLESEDVQTLMGLGLTFLQGKLYLDLVKSGKSTIRKIGETADVARQEAQRVTVELLNLGLVEKVLVNPTMFQPVPLKDVVSFLLERREKISLELQRKADILLKNFENTVPEVANEEETQFVITTGREAIIKKSKEIVDRTVRSCDIVSGNWKSASYAGTVFKQQTIRALKRHVKIRILTETMPGDHYIQEVYEYCFGYPLFEIRSVPFSLPAMLGIYDKKELLDFTSTKKLIGDSPMFWTNSLALIEAAQAFFHKLWRKGRPLNI